MLPFIMNFQYRKLALPIKNINMSPCRFSRKSLLVDLHLDQYIKGFFLTKIYDAIQTEVFFGFAFLMFSAKMANKLG